MRNEKLSVAVFSGGRGSATISRELVRDPRISLSVLVNAYDDGLSTGDLRDLIPGMLGPSDFRKNFSYLLDLYSAHQFALETLIEYRLPQDFTLEQFRDLPALAQGRARQSTYPAALHQIFENLDPAIRKAVGDYIEAFFQYYLTTRADFKFVDCSLGNLVFTGAYLKCGRSFNRAVAELGALFSAKAAVLNVTQGENRILAALKENGEVLERESKIVSPQHPARIADLFLLAEPLDAASLQTLQGLSFEEKRAHLRAREQPVQLSPGARAAILEADLIVYGPGTQFSSIWPSYKTEGMAEALLASPARVKAMVANLDADHDIQGFSATDLIDSALQFLGDPQNTKRLLTHLLYNQASASRAGGVSLDAGKLEAGRYKGVEIVQDAFESPARANVHSGMSVVSTLRALLARELSEGHKELEIYVDLSSRSLAMNSLMQEFLEVPWKETFSRVRLSVNHAETPGTKLPDYLEFRPLQQAGLFSEVEIFTNWLQAGTSEYLVTISGDGEYRLKEVLSSIGLLENSSFGAVFGSRTQSRRQFLKSIRSAYGESKPLYWSSWVGALAVSALFAARFQVILSDPLTGFRIFRRSALDQLRDDIGSLQPAAPMAITRLLIERDIEIAEVPVSYRTYKGFTNAKWRFNRGLKNVTSAFT